MGDGLDEELDDERRRREGLRELERLRDLRFLEDSASAGDECRFFFFALRGSFSWENFQVYLVPRNDQKVTTNILTSKSCCLYCSTFSLILLAVSLPLDSNLSANFATFTSTSRNLFRFSSSISFTFFAASTEISFLTLLEMRNDCGNSTAIVYRMRFLSIYRWKIVDRNYEFLRICWLLP